MVNLRLRTFLLGSALTIAGTTMANAGGFPSNLNLGALDGNNGFKLNGARTGEATFHGMAIADVNGDGFGDLIVGAPGATVGGAATGAAYVLYGKASGFAPQLTLGGLDGSNGFKVFNAAETGYANIGYFVAGVGDINDDGIQDFAIGAPVTQYSPRAGKVYVIFGRTSGFPAKFNLAALDGRNGFVLEGAPGERSGISIAAAGDVNHDGIDDIIVGGPTGYVVFGKHGPCAAKIKLADLNGTKGFKLTGPQISLDFTGYTVASAGDMNDDGVDDMLLMHPTLSMAYIVFGRTTGFPASIAMDQLTGTTGVSVAGTGADIGTSAAGVGDVNGDGIDDIMLSSSSGIYRFLVFGRGGAWPASLSVDDLDGANGVKMQGVSGGFQVAGIGDVNGDGVNDMLLADTINAYHDGLRVVLGRAGGFASTHGLVDLKKATISRLLVPTVNSGHILHSIAAGDINGDHQPDAVMAIPTALNGRGTGFVAFGTP